MRAQNVAPLRGRSRAVDVDMPQAQALGIFSFYSRSLWAIVHADQSQAVYLSEQGAAQSVALKNNRSRGCRALNLPFLHCAWLPSWPPAPSQPKKLSTLMNQLSPPNQPTPASTSNTLGRAIWAHARPALFLSADPRSAVNHRHQAFNFATAHRGIYAALIRNDNIWRPICGQLLYLLFFLSPSSPLAPNPRQSRCQWKNPLRLNQPRPANTSDLTGRAGSLWPAPFVRPFGAKVRQC